MTSIYVHQKERPMRLALTSSRCATLLGLSWFMAYAAHAQTTAALPNFSAPRNAAVIEEVTHPISVRDYQPAYEITQLAGDATSAEGVVAKYISAMKRGDYAGAYAVWDAPSQELIHRDEKSRGLTPEARIATWNRLFGNRRVFLTHRIAYGPYTLVEYEVRDAQDKVVAQETITLKTDGKTFQLTMDIVGSAVPQGWKTPGVRVQRLVDHAYKLK
jgi:hypothetical protein